MIERPLMTPDELKSIPKGSFVVMKTGTHCLTFWGHFTKARAGDIFVRFYRTSPRRYSAFSSHSSFSPSIYGW